MALRSVFAIWCGIAWGSGQVGAAGAEGTISAQHDHLHGLLRVARSFPGFFASEKINLTLTKASGYHGRLQKLRLPARQAVKGLSPSLCCLPALILNAVASIRPYSA